MASLARGFSYLIAAQVQAITFLLMAWKVGEWANKEHPMSVNWYAITFPLAILVVAQTFYVVVKAAMRAGSDGGASSSKSVDTKAP